MKTTNLASTNSYKIMGFPIPLPIIDEQRRIVNMLKSDIQMTDKAVDAIDRQTALLGERRKR